MLLRLAFLAALYGFLAFVALAAWRSLHAGTGQAGTFGELIVLDPARSRWAPGSRIRVAPGAVVGRDAANEVVMEEDTVSARHALLRFDGRRWWVEDLESTNGTFVNGQPVTGARRVRSGDEIRFGRVAVRFEAGSGARRNGHR